MKSLDFLFFYAGYPSLFSGCSGVREKSKRAVGTHHQSSRLPFSSNCSRSFSFSIALYFYWKTQERESHQYFTIGTRCWLPLFLSLFVALIIYYDMIGERLILFLCRKTISLLLLISFCLSIYLLTTLTITTTTTQFYYHSFKNSSSSWQYHLSSKRMCTKERERERKGNL